MKLAVNPGPHIRSADHKARFAVGLARPSLVAPSAMDSPAWQHRAARCASTGSPLLPPIEIEELVLDGFFSSDVLREAHAAPPRPSLQALMIEAFNHVLMKHGKSPVRK